MTQIIYKIEDAQTWAQALRNGHYLGSPLDLKDGFIHLSTPQHVRETAQKYMAGQEGLVLIGVDASKIGETLVWEEARGGVLFPHIYGPLPLDAVLSTQAMPLGPDGLHIFGPEIA